MSVSPGPTLPADITQHTLSAGLLESPVIWQGLLLAAAITAYLLFRPRRKDRITPRQSVGSRLVIIGTLAALAGVFWVNEYVGYIRTPHDLAVFMQRGTGFTAGVGTGLAAITNPNDEYVSSARTALDGARSTGPSPAVDNRLHVVRMGIPDPARGVPAGLANVMLPPGYDSPANAGRHYPVVYLLHGYPGGSSDDWFTSGDAVATMQMLLDDHLIQPMIIVAPDMTGGQPATDWECLNVPGGPQLEDYLVNTVVPQIDAKFRTVADRQHRGLGGMSGGGYCTLNIGLKHLDTFASLLISLPYDTLGDSASVLAGHPELIPPNTPRSYIPTMKFTSPVAVMIATGKSAPTDVDTTYRIANALSARGQAVAVHLEQGLTHTWRAARAALPYLLVYANQVFGATGTTGQAVPPHPVTPAPLPQLPPLVGQAGAQPTLPTAPAPPPQKPPAGGGHHPHH